jgi:hypothetical protein
LEGDFDQPNDQVDSQNALLLVGDLGESGAVSNLLLYMVKIILIIISYLNIICIYSKPAVLIY